MKILHIIPTLYRGGAERLTLDICVELQRRNSHEVRIVSFSDSNTYKSLSNQLSWDVIPSKVKLSLLKIDLSGTKELEAYIHNFAPDIIHTHLYETEITTRSIFYPKAKWFSHCHDNMPQFERFTKNTLLSRIKRVNYFERKYLLSRYQKNGGNNFVCISKDTFDYFKKNLPGKDYQIHLLPNAIDFNKFANPNRPKKIKKRDFDLISVGSLVDKKNQAFLLDVMFLLLQTIPNVHLHILGDGINRQKLEQKAANLKLTKNVTFHGIVPNVPELLWESDIYLHSATYEPFGLALVEAMAAGLPVVALDGMGNRDIINSNENGFLIKEQNAQVFVNTIIELTQNEKLYNRISANAVDFAKRYDIKNYVDELLLLYNRALTG
jgi:glycosyltransferase involved in cell wall biosynthesis